jgi:PAS domain-containing protein
MLPRLLPGVVQAVLLVENGQACLGVAQPFEFPHAQPTIDKILDTFTQISGEETRPQLMYVKTLGGNIPVSTEWQAVTELHLPLLTRLGPRGLIYVASGKKENLSDEVWRTFSLTAAQISAALENALLFQQVEQERARLAAILASSTDAVLVVNADGRIVLDNPAAWQVLGVNGAQSGSILAECTTNETLVDLFNAAMQGGKPTGEIPTPEGRTFFCQPVAGFGW